MFKGLERNLCMETLIKMLDSKVNIYIWKSEKELAFKGKVYQLYDNNEFDNYYISYLNFGLLLGVEVMITKERQ